MFIFGIVILAVAIGLIFSRDFRDWIGRQLTALGTIAQTYAPGVFAVVARYVRLYSIASLIVLAFAAFIVLIAVFIPSPVFKAIAFLFASFVCLGVWFPLGVFLKLFRLRNRNVGIFPAWLKAFVSWLCFIGFVSVVLPDMMSKPVVIFGGLLLLGFYAGLSTKFDFLNKVAPTIVLMLLLWVGWKYVAPNSYRATTRYIASKSEFMFSEADRSSVISEADARGTYGLLLKDVAVAYEVILKRDKKDKDNDGDKKEEIIETITEIPVSLKKDSLFLVVDHKRENYDYDGQSFVEIKLPNSNGSYVTGKKVWIEADLIKIGYRREIDPSLNPETGVASSKGSESCTLHPGEEWFPDHVFTQYEKIEYIVEYAPVIYTRADGSEVLVQPGRYSGPMPAQGYPAFKGADKRAKVTIIF